MAKVIVLHVSDEIAEKFLCGDESNQIDVEDVYGDVVRVEVSVRPIEESTVPVGMLPPLFEDADESEDEDEDADESEDEDAED